MGHDLMAQVAGCLKIEMTNSASFPFSFHASSANSIRWMGRARAISESLAAGSFSSVAVRPAMRLPVTPGASPSAAAT
ncbi:hypothetical protein GUJ93_ZPchr0010g9641 [Zizania palustris]|uniref:Uncharacterized protein n=1 Tax=Zizania palustris TaxID=103762 RepID=A0A8J5RTL1_ZIZPA|nr:hypothetical protein GUJ93_ZPchr0070g33438 [Zizania palustris]KAG8086501.1 hypothetical protein GUJ93_ZPchr0010g9641 [Zizania palustris]